MQYTFYLEHIAPLLQHVLVFLALAYLFTRTPIFTALVTNSLTLPDKAVIYLLFSGFCILGTIFSEASLQTADAIANTRAIGAVLGGLLGGPVVGILVGITGGAHRIISMSSSTDPVNFIDMACATATVFEGTVAGFVHHHLSGKGMIDAVFSPGLALAVALVTGIGHVLIILLFGAIAGNFPLAWNIEREIAIPMLIANPVGAALIVYMIREQKRACDNLGNSGRAWRIAEKTADIVCNRFDQASCRKMADIIREESKVGAVAITSRDELLAFSGVGEDHHRPGTRISSEHTLLAMNEDRVVFLDGIRRPYRCQVQAGCELGSVLIIPLRDKAEKRVFGSIKLYETKHKLFRNINRKLGEDIAHLLSSRILGGQYELQHELRIQDQYRLLTAQVNPHFLYSALATISHIVGSQPERARHLLGRLSDFFRKNLQSSADMTTLKEELEHVESYLEIEKARHEDRLQVTIDVPDHLYGQKVPVFTLQPIVENAIKHGISELIHGGRVDIRCREDARSFTVIVEDDAGLYDSGQAEGFGLKIDERIKIRFGHEYGVSVACEPGRSTTVCIHLPKG